MVCFAQLTVSQFLVKECQKRSWHHVTITKQTLRVTWKPQQISVALVPSVAVAGFLKNC